MDPFRGVEEYFYVAYDDYHEPSEGYAGMHVSQKLVAFPELYVDEAVKEPVPDVLRHYLRVDEG